MILLHAVVFISGASALIFENLWFYCAGLTLGNSVWATAIVLSSFMSGLAIGNGLSARFERRISQPLKVYAWIELTIGLTGCVLVLLFPRMTGILAPAFRLLLPVPWALNLVRLAVAFIVMLIPTIAMGATLPVLAKHLGGRDKNFGKLLGGLYGANTFGSVGGVLVCELFLVPKIGVAGSGFFAAGLNLLAAGAALLLSRREHVIPAIAAQSAVVTRKLSLSDGRILTIGFLSGGILLALEVVWFRFMLLFFDAYSLNFAIMLALVLIGIGAGGIAAAVWFRVTPMAHRFLPALCFISAISVVATYAVFHSVQGPLWTTQSVRAVFLCASVLIFPTSFFSGIIFTMLVNALHREGHSEGGATGLLAALNTVGSTCGALLASFVFLPVVGMSTSFFIMALTYGIAGVIALASREWRDRFGHAVPVIAAIMLFVPAMALFPFGMMKQVYLREPLTNYRGSDERLVALKEGQTETSQYLCHFFMGQPEYYRLVTNNHSMASTDVKSRRYMHLYAYFPFILHPSPKRAALICFGVGNTAKALTEDERLASIDIVDISKSILDLSKVVYPNPASNPLSDKRVRVHIEDGRFFLQTTPERFDIITAEPPPPFFAGVSNLYSREYFQLAYNRLNEGGMVTYWLPVDGLRTDEGKAIMQAFSSVFPNASLWTGAGLNWMMVGIKPPVRPVSEQAFRSWWESPEWRKRLETIGLDSPEMLGTTYIADGSALRQWTANIPPLTDNYPRRIGSRTRGSVQEYYGFIGFMNAPDRQAAFDQSSLIRSLWPDSVRSSSLHFFALQTSINAILSERSMPNVVLELHNNMDNPTVIKTLFWKVMSDFDFEQRVISGTGTVVANDKASFLYQAQLAVRDKRFGDAAGWLSHAAGWKDFALYPLRIYLLYRAGKRAEGSALGGELYDSLHSPDDRQGVQEFMNWMESMQNAE
jgi:spermidine synthase